MDIILRSKIDQYNKVLSSTEHLGLQRDRFRQYDESYTTLCHTRYYATYIYYKLMPLGTTMSLFCKNAIYFAAPSIDSVRRKNYIMYFQFTKWYRKKSCGKFLANSITQKTILYVFFIFNNTK